MTRRTYMLSTKGTIYIPLRRATCLEIHSPQTSKTPTLLLSVKTGAGLEIGKVRMTKGEGWLKFDIVCFTVGITKPQKTQRTRRNGSSKAETGKSLLKLQDYFSVLNLGSLLAKRSGGALSRLAASLAQSLEDGVAYSGTRGNAPKKAGTTWSKDG
jgi:hypothetical protein